MKMRNARIVPMKTDIPSTSSSASWSESEDRFRILAEISPNGICQIDLTGKALFTNDSWETITGISLKTMRDKNWLTKFQAKDGGNMFTEGIKKAENHKRNTNEYQIKVTPQSNRWVKGTTVGLFTKENKLKGFLITLTDITTQKTVQEELNIYKDRLDQAQKAGNIGIFDWDIEKNQLHWSSEQEKLYGFAPGSFIGKASQVSKVIHPNDKARVREEVQIALKKKEDYSSQFRVIFPDKSIRWLMTKAKLYLDKKQKPTRMVGITIDVTDEKQTESYRQFFAEASKILSFSLDYQTTLNNIAQIAIPTFGDWCSVDMLQSDGSIKLVALAHKDPKKVSWAKKLREQNPSNINDKQGAALAIKTGKSQFYPVIDYKALEKTLKNKKSLELAKKLGLKSVMIIPIFSAHSPIGAISFVTDESSRTYTTEDLSMAEELAERASLAIDNARLFRSEERAVAAREEFISIASHELKTPITSIKAFTQILKQKLRGKVEPDTLKMLDRTEGQIERLITLIRELLDITKIQAGKLSFSEEYLDLFRLVTEIVNDFQLINKSHEISLEGSGTYNVLGDKDRLGQVINNLISNAIKYSPNKKKIVITLTSDKNSVTVQVQDFGIGIDKASLPRVFERFFRGSNSESGSLSSLGLGLYISAEIIRRHHGQIWVQSKKGQGSTFFFQLPLAE